MRWPPLTGCVFFAPQADPDSIDLADDKGWTPLQTAAEWGLVSLIQLLLRHGADVHLADNKGQTPLHWAALCESTTAAAAVVELLSCGANVDARSQPTRHAPDGLTPLELMYDTYVVPATEVALLGKPLDGLARSPEEVMAAEARAKAEAKAAAEAAEAERLVREAAAAAAAAANAKMASKARADAEKAARAQVQQLMMTMMM